LQTVQICIARNFLPREYSINSNINATKRGFYYRVLRKTMFQSWRENIGLVRESGTPRNPATFFGPKTCEGDKKEIVGSCERNTTRIQSGAKELKM